MAETFTRCAAEPFFGKAFDLETPWEGSLTEALEAMRRMSQRYGRYRRWSVACAPVMG